MLFNALTVTFALYRQGASFPLKWNNTAVSRLHQHCICTFRNSAAAARPWAFKNKRKLRAGEGGGCRVQSGCGGDHSSMMQQHGLVVRASCGAPFTFQSHRLCLPLFAFSIALLPPPPTPHFSHIHLPDLTFSSVCKIITATMITDYTKGRGVCVSVCVVVHPLTHTHTHVKQVFIRSLQ